jgi:hypothetical protein
VALIAFGCLFTTFVPWDDEGYFLLSYRAYLAGKIPYDAIYSLYGPYTFIATGLLTAFDVSHVGHDGLRWIEFALLLTISGLFAIAVFRYTADFSVAIIVLLTIGMRLCGLARAVGHPQVFAIVLLPVMLILGTSWLTESRQVRRGMWVGLIVGVVLLTKTNIGVYVLLTYALLVSLQLTNKYWRTVSTALVLLIGSGLGVAMTLEKLRGVSERSFIFIYVVSLAAVVATAWFRLPRLSALQPRSLLWLFVGFAAALVLGFFAMLASGTSIAGLWGGLVAEPLRLTRAYHWPFYDASGKASKILCAAVVAISLAALFVARLPHRTAVVSWFKIVAGAVVLLATWYDPIAGLCASLLSVWLVILDTPDHPGAYTDRTFAALLALFYSLQLFP